MDPFVFIVIAVIVVVYLIYRAMRGDDEATVIPTGSSNTSDRSHSESTYFSGFTGNSYPFSEIDPDPNLPQIRTIHTKIRGVSKRNADGVDRQYIVRSSCHKGDALCFVREPTSSFDVNAIQVRRIVYSDLPDKPRMGEQIGYLSRSLAEEFAPRLDYDKFVLMAEILNFSGGDDSESVGVNIELKVYMPMPKGTRQAKERKRRSQPKKTADQSAPDGNATRSETKTW